MCGTAEGAAAALVPALEHHGLSLDPAVRERLLAVSAGDRRLASARAVTAGQRSALNGLRGSVPVRTFGDWKDPAPGFVEADPSRTAAGRCPAVSSGRWC